MRKRWRVIPIGEMKRDFPYFETKIWKHFSNGESKMMEIYAEEGKLKR